MEKGKRRRIDGQKLGHPLLTLSLPPSLLYLVVRGTVDPPITQLSSKLSVTYYFQHLFPQLCFHKHTLGPSGESAVEDHALTNLGGRTGEINADNLFFVLIFFFLLFLNTLCEIVLPSHNTHTLTDTLHSLSYKHSSVPPSCLTLISPVGIVLKVVIMKRCSHHRPTLFLIEPIPSPAPFTPISSLIYPMMETHPPPFF